MENTSVATRSGGSSELEGETLDAFASRLGGSLLAESSPGYEEARELWNAMIETRPALIARCADAGDVRTAISFATEHDLLISVRGAGHNIAGSGLCEGGLTIDLSQMRNVEVDPESMTAVVQPGATLGDLDAATLARGLAVPTGINSTTGIAGLTLGGGFGWLSRKYGLTIDSLISADVVTAGGEMIKASDTENPDLFWGLRGGGGNFGVVTSFTFELHPVGPNLLCGLVVNPFADADAALPFYREFTANCPDDLTVWMVLRDAPPLPFLPEEVHGTKVIVFAFVYAGDPSVGEELVSPLRKWGSPHGEHVGVIPFAGFQQAFDPLLTPGARNYWKSHNFSEISDDLISEIRSATKSLPSPQSEIFVAQVGGEAAHRPIDSTAYPHRDAAYVMNVHTRWEDPDDDARCVDWAREFFDATAPHATGGVYLNFVSEAADEARVRAAYGTHYDRLRELKGKYDPEN
ncbi:MAG: FAD-binding oxidoreductase, partial [Gemmatimonadota bacterium]